MTEQVYFRYSVEDHDADERYDLPGFKPSSDGSARWAAEFAAEDYHSNHDGWESSWPLTFAMYDPGDQLLGRYCVDRETVPRFTAVEVKEQSNER